MILTDREIETAIRCGQIIVEPRPEPTAFSSTSLDLTLASVGRRWNTSSGLLIKPGDAKYKYTEMMRHQEEVRIDNYQLEPGQLY